MLSILTGSMVERIACKALSNSEYEEGGDELSLFEAHGTPRGSEPISSLSEGHTVLNRMLFPVVSTREFPA